MATVSPSKTLTVLVADDSDMIRQALQRVLRPLPYIAEVDEAVTADETVASTMETRPDVVVLDIGMPGSGIAALRRIKCDAPDTKVVMLTNHAGPYYERVCRKAGADFFLDKSIEFERVPAVLARIAHS